MLAGVPAVDVVDSTWFAARAPVVGALLAQPDNWPRWWPDLELRVQQRRGPLGLRWTVPPLRRGPAAGLAGSAEVWLEPSCDGVVAHFFLRLRRADGGEVDARTARRVSEHYRRLTKRAFWALADGLDPGRVTRLTSASHTAVG